MKFDTVEDAVETICDQMHAPEYRAVLGDPWFIRFFSNINSWVDGGKPLTTEQAKIVLKAVSKSRQYFIQQGMPLAPIVALLKNPVYRHTPTLSAVMPREVRYLGDGLLGFRFKRNDIIIEDIKAMQRASLTPQRIEWNPRHRFWHIGISESTLAGIMLLITKHRFDFDDVVAGVLADAHNDQRGPTKFHIDDEGNLIAEVSDNDLIATWVSNVLGGVAQ